MTGPAVLAAPPVARAGAAEASDWLRRVKPELDELLHSHGAVHLKGLPVDSVPAASAVRDALIEKPLSRQEHVVARRSVAPGLFAEYPWSREQALCPQHEQSYLLEIPRLVLLMCLQPAAAGGEVLLADGRRVLGLLPHALTDRLRRHGWLMIRNFADRVGVSWQEAFQVSDRDGLRDTLRQERIGYEWSDKGGLRTARLRSAIIHHPATGDACFFNHLSFFSEYALNPDERAVLKAILPDGLMLNTLVGDGSPLTAEAIALVDKAYGEVAVPVDLAAGEVLVVDNILMAHGRRAFTGRRTMLTAAGDPVDVAGCRPTVTAAPSKFGHLNGRDGSLH